MKDQWVIHKKKIQEAGGYILDKMEIHRPPTQERMRFPKKKEDKKS